MELLHKEKTELIIKIFYQVYNELGYGFLEKVYENALYFELKKSGFDCQKQFLIKVWYKEQMVGEYFADVIVDNEIILELKAAEGIVEEHELQLINYLKATEIEVGLLLNFGRKPEFRRKIFTNNIKSVKTR